jgi:hypothetical protein
MGEQISKSDANPVLLAVVNLFFFGGIGYFLMGQKKKAIATMVYVLIGSFCLFGLGWILVPITAYDAYLLGQKLANGESIDEGECALGFLSSLPGFN